MARSRTTTSPTSPTATNARSGGTGRSRCSETTYARLLTDPAANGRTFRLHGEPITQALLVDHLNTAFGTQLVFRSMTVDEYRADRVAALGEFMGTVIAGIYEGIRDGANDRPSDFEAATGRPHQTWDDFFASIAS